jgi:hypothetical protein
MEPSMTGRHIAATVALASALLLVRSETAAAQAQTPVPTPAPAAPAPQAQGPTSGSKLWIVGGGGFSITRAGCATCPRSGVFTNTKAFFFDVGRRVNPRVDFGVEVLSVSGRLEDAVDSDSIRTTFIVGIAQFRPKLESGFYLRAGMGVGFAGNGIQGPIGRLAPPYSTNALGVTYGIGWIFRRERRWAVQANFSHHVAALGELTPVSGETVKNVVGNYWTSGMAIAIR